MRLSDKDWADLFENHPAAYSFLLRRSLLNEYRLLNAISRQSLTHWQVNRLAELEIITAQGSAAEK